MRILFLLTQDIGSPSGMGRYFPIAKELAGQGHQVTIAALHPDYKNEPQKQSRQDQVDILYVSQMHVQKSGGQKTYFSPWKMLVVALLATIKLTQAAMTVPANIIIVGKPHPMNTTAAFFAKRVKKCKIYLDCDDYEIGITRFQHNWQRWVLQLFDHWGARMADLILTNTMFNFDRLSAMTPNTKKVYYLPNGVDSKRFVPPSEAECQQLRKELALNHRFVIAFVGTLGLTSHPVDLLLKAFKQVNLNRPCTLLLLVGGGEDFHRVKHLAQKLGIEKSTLFCGSVPPKEVPLYYAVSNLTVDPVFDNPAARGRSPLKIYESLSLGIPVVTGDVGDRKAVLEGGRLGVLVEPGDATALAEGILALIDDTEKRAGISSLALSQRAQWSWSSRMENSRSLFQ